MMVGRRKSNHALPPRMYFKSGSYYYVTKANKWLNLGKDLPTAKLKWAELEGAGTPVGVTMEQVIDRYLREIAPTKAKATQDGNAMEAENLKKVFGHMPPADVRPEDVYAYMQARAIKRVVKNPKTGRERTIGGPIRANRERSLLSAIFSYACSWGYCDSNPCREVKAFKEPPRTRYVEEAEFRAVRDMSPPLVAAMMDLAFLTGQRGQDLLALRRSDLTDDGITVTQKKTVRSKPVKLLIEWSDELLAAVNILKGLERPCASVFLVTGKGGGKLSESGWKTAWGRAMDAAMKAGVISERFHFHDIRAKTITDLEAQGRDSQALSGHATREMIDRVYKRRKATKVAPFR